LTGKRLAKQRDRPGIHLVVALVASVIVIGDCPLAQAFDFFGLFGSDDTPPAVSRTAIPYSFTVEVAGGAAETWAAEVAREHGFSDVSHTIEIFGLCGECAPA